MRNLDTYVFHVALTLFALLSLLWSWLVRTEGATNLDPLWDYYQNPAIQSIYFTALVTDISVAFAGGGRLALVRLQRVELAESLSLTLVLLSLVGATLTWLELWYGSTFYYGEVRDKQGLPFTVNHGGPIGSFFFLTYVIWCLPSKRLQNISLWAKMTATLILLLGHWLVLWFVEDKWFLWLS